MSNKDKKRYYWLKLDKDFFKRHDIRVVESMPNGKDYILFYLKLLCESTTHEGYLRFSETIPYSDEMLATITNTNIDVVRSAVKIFTELKMMTFLDDGTLYLEQVQKMIGSETGAAIRQREYRTGKVPAITEGATLSQDCHQEIDKDKEIEKEIDIDTDIDNSSLFGDKDISNSNLLTLPLEQRLQIKDQILKSIANSKSEEEKKLLNERLHSLFTPEELEQMNNDGGGDDDLPF